MHSGSSSIIIIALLILWSVYRRIRRTIGSQQLRPRSLVTRGVIFVVIGIAFVAAELAHPQVLLGDLLGVVVGAALAYLSARTTSYEARSGGWYYRPNPWMGAIVLVLFLGRIVYRYAVVMSSFERLPSHNALTAGQQNSWAAYTGDWWTAALFFVMIAYYIAYSAFVLLRVRALDREQPPSFTVS